MEESPGVVMELPSRSFNFYEFILFLSLFIPNIVLISLLIELDSVKLLVRGVIFDTIIGTFGSLVLATV